MPQTPELVHLRARAAGARGRARRGARTVRRGHGAALRRGRARALRLPARRNAVHRAHRVQHSRPLRRPLPPLPPRPARVTAPRRVPDPPQLPDPPEKWLQLSRGPGRTWVTSAHVSPSISAAPTASIPSSAGPTDPGRAPCAVPAREPAREPACERARRRRVALAAESSAVRVRASTAWACAAPPETCPISTEGGTRRVQLVREGGEEGGGPVRAARTPPLSARAQPRRRAPRA